MSAPTFDPAAWFAAWSDHGGIAMLIGDRLWISRAPAIDSRAAQTLDALKGHLALPGAGSALAGLLRANAGEVRQRAAFSFCAPSSVTANNTA